MKNVFIIVSKSFSQDNIILQDSDRLPIFKHRIDAEKNLLKFNKDAPYKIRYTVRKINIKELHNLIK